MKKSCAMKLIAFALVAVMMLSTAIGAMAASVTSTVRYTGDTANVKTQVTGLTDETMVTYMVTNGKEIAATADSDIAYIDQQNVANGAADFGFTSTKSGLTNRKIFVGADTWSAPQTTTPAAVASGAAVKENGVLISGDAIPADNMNLEAEAGEATKITLKYGKAQDVAYVLIDDAEVDFAVAGENTIYVFNKLTADSIISIGYYAPYVSAASIYDATETVTEGTHFSKSYGFVTGQLAHIQVAAFKVNLAHAVVGDKETGGGSVPSVNNYNENMQSYSKTAKDLSVSVPYNTELRDEIVENVAADGTSHFHGYTCYVGSEGSVTAKTAEQIDLPKWVVDGIVADTEVTGTANCVYPAGSDAAVLISKDGDNVTFAASVNVPVAGTYTLAFRIGAYDDARKPAVTINGKKYETTMDTEALQYGTIATVDVELTTGDNTLAIGAADSVDGPVRFDSVTVLAKDAMGDKVLTQMKERCYWTSTPMPEILTRVINDRKVSAVSVSLGKVVKGTDGENQTVTAFARAPGNFYKCGVKFDTTEYDAMAVAGTETGEAKGAFAIELYGASTDMSAFDGKTVQAYVYATEGGTATYSENTKTIN